MITNNEKTTQLCDVWCDATVYLGQLSDALDRFYAILPAVLADPTIPDAEKTAAREYDRNIRWEADATLRALHARDTQTAEQGGEPTAA